MKGIYLEDMSSASLPLATSAFLSSLCACLVRLTESSSSLRNKKIASSFMAHFYCRGGQPPLLQTKMKQPMKKTEHGIPVLIEIIFLFLLKTSSFCLLSYVRHTST
jgi:hypothetical protein